MGLSMNDELYGRERKIFLSKWYKISQNIWSEDSRFNPGASESETVMLIFEHYEEKSKAEEKKENKNRRWGGVERREE